jgi:hypothetical protein
LNGTHQVVAHDDDDVNVLVENINMIKRNIEALLLVSRELGIEINTENAKYRLKLMSRRQNAEPYLNIKVAYKSFGNTAEFGCWGKLTNRSSIHEQIKSILISGNACCCSVQNILSSNILSKNANMKLKFSCCLLRLVSSGYRGFIPGANDWCVKLPI